MELFWRDNRLQLKAQNGTEESALLLLVETEGLRNTLPCFAAPEETIGPAHQLEIEIGPPANTNEGWVGRVPAISGVEYAGGRDEKEAFLGAMLELFRSLGDRILQDKELPREVNAWFRIVRRQELSEDVIPQV